GLGDRLDFQRRIAGAVMRRKGAAARAATQAERGRLATRSAGLDRAAGAAAERRAQWLARAGAALRAHDPQRTLERGYALALDAAGQPLPDAGAVRAAQTFDLRMAGGTVPARVGATENEEDA
ncbi:MAG: Exonuclease large subunit, partial [Thermoleophilaceae bacterium]|nr:Exonuclease large subunit [Thermoleophilaceae bacterium]